MIEIEICCNSVASAMAAREGGAHRIELCHRLECGGLTPDMDDVATCVGKLGLRTHVLVRPREGDFRYTDAELDAILRDIERCGRLGASAVVVGFLTADGDVDTALTRKAVEAAGDMEVTFHRAFDEARQDPLEALEAIADCGCRRLLTSGQRPTAIEGAETIRRLVQASAGRVAILAGSGITPGNVAEVIRRTGVHEVHGSCKATLPDGTVATDARQVRQIVENIQRNEY